MRKLLFALTISSGITAAAQDSLTTYYNQDWKEIADPQGAKFYRRAKMQDGLLFVKDYFKKGDVLQMTGSYQSDSIKHGDFVYYYQNGWKEDEGSYSNGKKEGAWNGWHENGKRRYKETYKEGYCILKRELWYDNGQLRGYINYSDNLAAIRTSAGSDSTVWQLRGKGEPVGRAEFFHRNGKIAARETWNHKLVDMKCWDEKGNKEPAVKDTQGNYVFEVMPRFDGDMNQFLRSNLVYPPASRNRGETGRPVVTFVVEKDGTIVEARVVQSSGYLLLDDEALRVVYLMSKKWIPGKDHNIPVRVYYTLPMTFKLK